MRSSERRSPTVSVVIPTYQEALHIDACLAAVRGQTYPHVVEVLVVDGRSTDDTRARAEAAGAVVVDNPGRSQARALNIGLDRARGEVVVRVDGHCVLDPDHVERCVAALEQTGAAIVGGAMTPVAAAGVPRAVAAAMASPLGAGPARFHVGGDAGWVDTVYLGAYRTELARRLGGYATDVGVNEDAEFAHRMAPHGGVWFDPAIRSTYAPRRSVGAVARQFHRYGRSRALTVRRHPGSLSWRQLVAPLLVLGLLSPARRPVAVAYAAAVVAETARITRRIGRDGLWAGLVLPAMHLPWGAGMLLGLLTRRPVRRPDGSAAAAAS